MSWSVANRETVHTAAAKAFGPVVPSFLGELDVFRTAVTALPLVGYVMPDLVVRWVLVLPRTPRPRSTATDVDDFLTALPAVVRSVLQNLNIIGGVGAIVARVLAVELLERGGHVFRPFGFDSHPAPVSLFS